MEISKRDTALWTDISGQTPKEMGIGDWTDDTDMMLCIAEAIIEDKGVNMQNIARHFKEWALGDPMGIGENTYKVLSIGDYVEPVSYTHLTLPTNQ